MAGTRTTRGRLGGVRQRLRAAGTWARPRARRWAPTVLAVLGLTLACYAGGVATTSLFPTTVETRHYRADVRLSALPTLTSTLHSPTSFGDIDLEFTSLLPAPGVDATVEVKENITDVFDDRRVSISSLQPSTTEVSAALASAVSGVGLRFAAGAVGVGLVTVGLVTFGRRRRPSWRHVAATGTAVLVAVGGTGLGVWDSYQPQNLSSYKTSGLLGTLRRNAGLLGDVEARANQATPYIKNLLALSQALQEKFVPQELNQPAAARFLLVSDIHGANQYPVMKGVIKDEGITAVVDSGDLTNFGSVAEAEAAGLFRSISQLGVPYVFVRGNHDANSPTDRAILRRMARIPNVILLQPDAGTFTEATIDGVRIAGFNDPRWFGDDNKDNAAKQQPSVDAFNRTFAGRDVPDMVVSHEPSAVKGVDHAGVLVNGHIHTDELDGNRIGVGTFTGGGTVSHLVEEPGGELTGQPYAFDIAVFGQDCGLTSLVRYTYRNLIEGRPAYDDVTVINGRTIEKDRPTGRVCRDLDGVQTATVPVVPESSVATPSSTTPTLPSATPAPATGSPSTPPRP
ncbi:metallophosphoesterase family protein [Oryzihumus sp.]|uniref:metallophosphoesterase family protein n=1 Tax=Oryzihumus sp. TaxID=1968903 RepID=UPI002EDBACD9